MQVGPQFWQVPDATSLSRLLDECRGSRHLRNGAIASDCHGLPQLLPRIALRHGEVLWILEQLGFQGTARDSTFYEYSPSDWLAPRSKLRAFADRDPLPNPSVNTLENGEWYRRKPLHELVQDGARHGEVWLRPGRFGRLLRRSDASSGALQCLNQGRGHFLSITAKAVRGPTYVLAGPVSCFVQLEKPPLAESEA